MGRIVGLGSWNGDDAVGFAVIDEVRALGGQGERIGDPTALVDLLDGGRVVLVDAVLGGEVGALIVVPRARLATAGAVSTHAVGVTQAVELAEALGGDASGLVLLGVGVEARGGVAMGLSPAVAAAVPAAARRAMELLEADDA
jgi:hydrogenase maturation protease